MELTQEQLDALLATAGITGGGHGRTDGAAAAGQAAGRGRRTRRYDFRNPDKFSKEQLRTLLTLHENFCRVASTTLSAVLRTVVQVSTVGAEQRTYGDFVRALPDPTVLAVFSLAPFPGNSLAELSPVVAFAMIDRLLGGPGYGLSSNRAITELETVVVRRLFHAIFESLAEAWRGLGEARPRLESLETNPFFVQIVAPSEIVAHLSFVVKVGNQAGDLNLCIPFTTMEKVLPLLSTRQWGVQAAHQQAEDRARLLRELAGVRLPLTVELGRAVITVGDLVHLAPGDVVTLDTPRDGPVDVLVKGRVKFRGHPGRSGKRLAVRITAVAVEGEVG